MKSHEAASFNVFGLLFFGTLLLVILTFSNGEAGFPRLEEECHDPDNMQVKTRYDQYLQVFAEARRLPPKEQKAALEKGYSRFVIYINPERYYLGRYTQIWLYHRQCVHIQESHWVVRENSRDLDIEQEKRADCLAIQAMHSDSKAQISMYQIESIERDIERLIRENRWNEVLAGPQRRISLIRCSQKK